ncbi:hypothetical protein TEA_022473 [Camellia sinensis var. sinensis]|uniref:Bet v I/Major latex protein domain-containing protein n=2 Tax=Camellia sinensis TaxID=4442 RepID=A0A4S4E0U7_CAMSN|nr:hypothetical protein TEA_022473 [Camellia sinensis var. sinensis]
MKGEVVLNVPAEKMCRDNEIISKINPEMLAAAEYVNGDGNPAVSGYVTESTEKIQRVEIGRSVTYSVIGVDLRKMYDPDRVTLSFIPVEGKEREKCIAEWKAEFEQLTPATPPHKVRDAALGFLKVI